MKTLRDLDLKGKKVLMRVDFNVPLRPDGTVADPTRIEEALPSIRYVLENGGTLILMSHLGRPDGKQAPQFSLAPCAKVLEEMLGTPIHFAPDCVGEQVEQMAKQLRSGEVLLLENLRFHSAEEKPESDPEFAHALARLGDIYVNDAFGTAHRAHSSTASIAKDFSPQKRAAGFLIEKEVAFLSTLLSHPKHPFYALLGGAKTSTKIGVLQSLLGKVDAFFFGGGMCYTFLKAKGIAIGDSLYEEKSLPIARNFLDSCTQRNIPVHLPIDLKIAHHYSADAEWRLALTRDGIPQGWQGMDIGPQTLEQWQGALQQSATIFWNGPMGVFEFPRFAGGTQALARMLANLPAITIVGGGDSVAAIQNLNLHSHFAHVSTGGGATLEYLELGHLPGIDAL